MIGEYFLDTCITICCSTDDSDPRVRTIFDAIKSIISWYKKEVSKDDVPIDFMNKLDVSLFLVEHRIKTKKFNFDRFIEKLKNGKAKDMVPILESRKIEISKEDLEEFFNEVLSKKRICDLFEGKKKLQGLLNDIETGNFIDDAEIVERWENAISRSWDKITQIKRVESIEAIQSLDLLNDDYSAVEAAIRQSYNKENIIKTGYKSVDKLFSNGGFERSRLYIVGGTSGIGKSTFLDNLPVNAINGEEVEGDYLIITGENLIAETLERLYCIFTGISHEQLVINILNDPTFSLKTEIQKVLRDRKSNIVLKYFKSGRTTTEEIRVIIDEVAQLGNLKAAYIDYLDLLNSKFRIEDKRIDLGYVCQDLKDFAIEYELPIVTPTQLNRSGYDKEVAPTLTSMSESMKKVDHADFVLYLQQPTGEVMFSVPHELGGQKICKKVRATVLKNRNGEVGSSVNIMNQLKHNQTKIFNYRFEELPRISDSDPENPTVPESYSDQLQEEWGKW